MGSPKFPRLYFTHFPHFQNFTNFPHLPNIVNFKNYPNLGRMENLTNLFETFAFYSFPHKGFFLLCVLYSKIKCVSIAEHRVEAGSTLPLTRTRSLFGVQ